MINKIRFSGFDWDEGNLYKCQKHGLTLYEIEQLFLSDFYLSLDSNHSFKEERLIAYGKTKEGKGIFTAFTIRQKAGEYLIRPISARYMHKKELEQYEKEITKVTLR